MKYAQEILCSTLMFLVACGDGTSGPDPDPDPDPQPVQAAAVTNVGLSDDGEMGDPSDMRVAFDVPSDETGIAEYRVVIVRASQASGFTLEEALGVAPANMIVVATGADHDARLSADAVDHDGNTIEQEVGYRAFVVSVADGTDADESSIASNSSAVTLRLSPARPATRVMLDDQGNDGNAGDLNISFDRPASDGIAEYRLIVVKSSASDVFGLADAQALSADRYAVHTSPAGGGGGFVDFSLSATTLDSDGDAIVEGVPYRAFVLSVADRIDAGIDALSDAANEIVMAQTTVKVTYLNNEGVLISDGNTRILIDAAHRTNSFWIFLPLGELNRLETGAAPYSGIDLALISHSHGDHFSANSISALAGANPNIRIIGPPQAVSGLGGLSQVVPIAPAFRTRQDTVLAGVNVRVLHLKHFDQFGNDFSSVENYGYEIEMGGLRILHLGDVEYSLENFESFDLETRGIDIVILPTFNTLLSQSNADLIAAQIAPAEVIASHIRSGVQADFDAIASFYPDAIVFDEPLEFIRR